MFRARCATRDSDHRDRCSRLRDSRCRKNITTAAASWIRDQESHICCIGEQQCCERRLQATSAFYCCCQSATQRLRASVTEPPTTLHLERAAHDFRRRVRRCQLMQLSKSARQFAGSRHQRRKTKEPEAVGVASPVALVFSQTGSGTTQL